MWCRSCSTPCRDAVTAGILLHHHEAYVVHVTGMESECAALKQRTPVQFPPVTMGIGLNAAAWREKEKRKTTPRRVGKPAGTLWLVLQFRHSSCSLLPWLRMGSSHSLIRPKRAPKCQSVPGDHFFSSPKIPFMTPLTIRFLRLGCAKLQGESPTSAPAPPLADVGPGHLPGRDRLALEPSLCWTSLCCGGFARMVKAGG
jgi:hypothetical protein